MPNVLLLRLDETADLIRPVDAAGNLAELLKTGAAFPEVVDAALGRGRSFVSAESDGLAALDVVAGATLLTRNATIQAVLRWDIAAAAAYGSPQTIYARGKGTAAAEYCGAGLELRVVNAALRIAELRWIWHDLAGALKTQVGGHFQVPATGFVMLTATRRWVTSTRVVLRHYLGDQLLSEVESVDGSIGGGTTGTTQIGTRYTGAAYGRFFDGVIDELRVVDEDITGEEIAATWRRITIEQPRAYQLMREMHDPGFPMSSDPASRVQRETRMWGDGLGFASAQAENIRANILPDRAYGATLEQWEAITKRSPKPGDDVDTRRRRVVGTIRQRRGVSIPGIGDAVGDLLDTDPANLSIVAFDQTVRDSFATLNTTRWRYDPAAQWTIAGAALRVVGTGTIFEFYDWHRANVSIGGDGRGAQIFAKLTPTTITNDDAVGLVFSDRAHNNAFSFAYRRDAGGVLRLSTEIVIGGVRQGIVDRNNPAALDPVWLQLRAQDPANYAAATETVFDVGWSFTSAVGPFTWVTGIHAGFKAFQWAGLFARTTDAVAAGQDVAIDDVVIRAPYGDRSFRFYVVRDPTIPGAPDLLGANGVIDGLKQAHTKAHAVTTLVALYDDDSTTYDGTPMGGT